MAKSRTRHRMTWQGAGHIEVLETRALLSGIPSAAGFNAFDDLNQVRLANKQTIDQSRIDNRATVLQLVADGQAATQSILADLQTAKDNLATDRANHDMTSVATDRQQISSDQQALRQVRRAMKRGQAIGSLVDQGLLRVEGRMNNMLIQFHHALKRGVDPQTVDTNGTAALNNIASIAQDRAQAAGTQISDIDTQINGFVTTPTPIPTPQFQLTGSISGTHVQGGTSTPTQLSLPATTFSDNQNVNNLLIQEITQLLVQKYTVPTTVNLTGMSVQGNNMTGNYSAQAQGGTYTDAGTFQVAGRALDPNFFKHQVFNGQFSGRLVDDGSTGCPGNASVAGNIQIVVDHTSDSVFQPGGTVTVNLLNLVQTPSPTLRNNHQISNGICDSYDGNHSGSANVNSFTDPITVQADDYTLTIQLNGSAPGRGTWTLKASADTGKGSFSFA